jgi:hypothetical protein
MHHAPRVNARHLTVRAVPPPLAKALERERRRSGKSLNQTVIDALARGLGVSTADRQPNGLEVFAGTWSKADLTRFEKATTVFERVDPEVWR